MPARLKAYLQLMRFHRPWPILLILFPTYWGLFLGPNHPSIKEFFIFSIGVILTRAAGCAINDYFDRDIDGQITRTKVRPLQSGAIKPHEAIFLFLGLMFVAFLLLLFLKLQVIVLGFVAFFLTLGYPLAKRFMYFPQVVLGIAFNFGLIMANLQVNNQVSALAWGYYAFSILWTVHYDTLYALSDYQDDLKIGVKSIATYFKHRVYIFLGITSILQVLALTSIWSIQGISMVHALLILALIAFSGVQYSVLLRQREAIGLKLFTANIWVGALVLLGVLV